MVVVNEASEISREIGQYYAQRRAIPDTNVCRITAPDLPTIARVRFEETIQEPIAECLKANSLQDQVLYLVTTSGLPLVIEGDTGPVGDLASVDSELALLYTFMVTDKRPNYGKVENAFFASRFDPEAYRPFTRQDQEIYLVSRLVGETPDEAFALIDRGLSANHPEGRIYFDLPAQRRTVNREQAEIAREWLGERGVEVILEETSGPPESPSSVLGYCFLDREVETLPIPEWIPGGLALALSPAVVSRGEGFELAPELKLADGATGFGGFIGAAGVDAQFHPQTLFASYLAGFGLVESYYRASRYVGWRQLVIGDPLVAPFADQQQRAEVVVCPEDAETGLPGCFARRRRTFLSEHYYSEAAAIDPLLRAEALLAAGEREQALQFLQSSASLNPFIPQTLLALAELLEEDGDYQGAFENYEKAFRLGKRNGDLYRKLAVLGFRRLGDPEKARPYALWLYAKGGRNDPEIVRLWADLNMAQGNTREAESAYNRLIESSQTPPAFALATLGKIYWSQQDRLRAEKLLQRALEVQAGRPAGETADFDVEETRRLLAQINGEASTQASIEPKQDAPMSVPANTPRVSEAKVLTRTPLQYPDSAKTEGIEGLVVLRVYVDEYGQFLKADVVQGRPALAKAALQAVQLWEYQPRMVNGKRTPGELTIVLRFSLDSRSRARH